jgi:predicted transcriptional regulator
MNMSKIDSEALNVGLEDTKKRSKGSQKVADVMDSHDGVGGTPDRFLLAVDALVSGASITDAATTAGVRRETVSRWIHENPVFKAELNRRREEIRIERRVSLGALIVDIEAAIRRALNNPETPPVVTLQTGLSVLPKLYALMDGQSIGPLDAEKIIQRDADPLRNLMNDSVSTGDIMKILKQAGEELRST